MMNAGTKYAALHREYTAVVNRLNRRKPCTCKGLRHTCPDAATVNSLVKTSHDMALALNALHKELR